jgi:hypothetical protein
MKDMHRRELSINREGEGLSTILVESLPREKRDREGRKGIRKEGKKERKKKRNRRGKKKKKEERRGEHSVKREEGGREKISSKP